MVELFNFARLAATVIYISNNYSKNDATGNGYTINVTSALDCAVVYICSEAFHRFTVLFAQIIPRPLIIYTICS